MIAGFKSNPLVCRGVIGDGCGGDRYFLVENSTLKAYDEMSDSYIVLQENIIDAISIKKSGCLVTVECRDEYIEFDLSTMA